MQDVMYGGKIKSNQIESIALAPGKLLIGHKESQRLTKAINNLEEQTKLEISQLEEVKEEDYSESESEYENDKKV